MISILLLSIFSIEHNIITSESIKNKLVVMKVSKKHHQQPYLRVKISTPL